MTTANINSAECIVIMGGNGRVGLVKRLSQDTEIEWSNYKKFSVESKMVTPPTYPKE